MKLIYLASPYSHRNPLVRWWRWLKVSKIQAYLTKMNSNCAYYGPISQNHIGASFVKLPKDFVYWQKSCERIIRACDEILVIKMEGWNDSRGVRAEIECALKLGKPVNYLEIDVD